MSTGSKWVNGVLTFFDKGTHETVQPLAPVQIKDDFEGTVIATTAAGVKGWTVKDTSAVGVALPAIRANQPGGVVRLTLDAQAEKQESGLYLGDALNFNLDKGPIFECRASAAVLPTGQAEIYFGLANAYVEGPIAEADAGPTIHGFFCLDGSGAVTVHTDDTTNDNDAVATGITAVAGTYNIFRIDFTNPADVKFFIDGVGVATGTTFDMSTGTNVVTQPFVMVHKEAGAGLGTLDVDYVHVWSPR